MKNLLLLVPANKMKLFSKPKKGFTLIELLLYIVLAGTVLLTVSIFLFFLLQMRIKNQTIAEVEEQGVQIIQIISQKIRNAQKINSPPIGQSSPQLSLDMPQADQSPTVIDLIGKRIRIREGQNQPQFLSSSRIEVSNLQFFNLSKEDSPGTIRIQFTLTHKNPEMRIEFEYSKTFISSASLRK